MNRSSGLLIFSSAYVVCMLALFCLLQVKYDSRSILNDRLVVPTIAPELLVTKEPVHYVVMNPIRKDYPVRIARTHHEPNILIATIVDPVLARQEAQREKELRKLAASGPLARLASRVAAAESLPATEPAPGSVPLFDHLRQKMSAPRTRLVSGRDARKSGQVASHRRVIILPRNPAAVSMIEPHLLVANDHDGILNIQSALDGIRPVPGTHELINRINDNLMQLIDSGMLDSGMCESCLYRISGLAYEIRNDLLQADKSLGVPNGENSRLADHWCEQIDAQVQAWIDRLNGTDEGTNRVLEDMDLRTGNDRLKMAVRAVMSLRLFR